MTLQKIPFLLEILISLSKRVFFCLFILNRNLNFFNSFKLTPSLSSGTSYKSDVNKRFLQQVKLF